MVAIIYLRCMPECGKKPGMSRKHSKSSGSIISIVLLLIFFLILSNCGKKISDTDRQATRAINKTESVIQDTQFWETHHAHVTSVQETIERDRVIATATAIYKRTIKPTLDYESTHEMFVRELKQQQTVESIFDRNK